MTSQLRNSNTESNKYKSSNQEQGTVERYKGLNSVSNIAIAILKLYVKYVKVNIRKLYDLSDIQTPRSGSKKTSPATMFF